MSQIKRAPTTARERALDELLGSCPEIFDDALWDLKTGKITPDQYGRITEQYIEQRIVEMRQRPMEDPRTEEADDGDEHEVGVPA